MPTKKQTTTRPVKPSIEAGAITTTKAAAIAGCSLRAVQRWSNILGLGYTVEGSRDVWLTTADAAKIKAHAQAGPGNPMTRTTAGQRKLREKREQKKI